MRKGIILWSFVLETMSGLHINEFRSEQDSAKIWKEREHKSEI